MHKFRGLSRASRGPQYPRAGEGCSCKIWTRIERDDLEGQDIESIALCLTDVDSTL